MRHADKLREIAKEMLDPPCYEKGAMMYMKDDDGTEIEQSLRRCLEDSFEKIYKMANEIEEHEKAFFGAQTDGDQAWAHVRPYKAKIKRITANGAKPREMPFVLHLLKLIVAELDYREVAINQDDSLDDSVKPG